MKYSPSYDDVPRADFLIKIRLSKKEVERLRRYLKKRGGVGWRGLDIDVRRFVTETGSCTATNDLVDFAERAEHES